MISVLLPTYRRPQPLIRCLKALELQVRAPDEVLAVVREEDVETRNMLSNLSSPLHIRAVIVRAAGLVAALNSGLEAAQGAIVAITDDDAAPRPDWLSRITRLFEGDSKIGGVGGRDVVHHGPTVETGARRVVGKVQWFGRVVGNHHLGVGPPRQVEVLKGVNMSFRRAALGQLRFDQRLHGSGAQVCSDMAMCLLLKRSGWNLIYDPEILVDHYPARRFDEDQRDRFSERAVSSAVHNETVILLEYLPRLRRVAFGAWSVLIGTRSAPGLVQLLRLIGRHPHTLARYTAAMRGRWDGFQTWKEDRPILVVESAGRS